MTDPNPTQPANDDDLNRVLRRRATDDLKRVESDLDLGVKRAEMTGAEALRRIRERGDGLRNGAVMPITDEEAVAMGWQKPSWRLRLRSWWTRAQVWLGRK